MSREIFKYFEGFAQDCWRGSALSPAGLSCRRGLCWAAMLAEEASPIQRRAKVIKNVGDVTVRLCVYALDWVGSRLARGVRQPGAAWRTQERAS
jgi:hypothetical protein